MKHPNKPFIVYCHTNIANNKKYFGITCQTLSERFRNGKGYKTNKHFYNSILKYGWDNFNHEVLYENLTLEEAKNKEVELIKTFKTQNPTYGYNSTPGGEVYYGEDHPWYGRHHTEKSKLLMSLKRKGVPKSEEHKRKISESNKGRVFSEETRRKMSKNHPDISGSKNPCYGKKLSPERIKQLVAASKTPKAIAKMKQNKVWYSGKDNPNAKKVICLDTNKIYDTIKEAAEDINTTASRVSDVCHGRLKHIKKHHFMLLEDYNEKLVR